MIGQKMTESRCKSSMHVEDDAVKNSDTHRKVVRQHRQYIIVVSDDTLADIAKQNGLQELIILSKKKKKLGCRKLDSICACTFEAILGAYYLDNKFDELKKYIEKTFAPYINEVQNHFEKYNAKQILQEYTQGQTQETPVYNVINEQGAFNVSALYPTR